MNLPIEKAKLLSVEKVLQSFGDHQLRKTHDRLASLLEKHPQDQQLLLYILKRLIQITLSQQFDIKRKATQIFFLFAEKYVGRVGFKHLLTQVLEITDQKGIVSKSQKKPFQLARLFLLEALSSLSTLNKSNLDALANQFKLVSGELFKVSLLVYSSLSEKSQVSLQTKQKLSAFEKEMLSLTISCRKGNVPNPSQLDVQTIMQEYPSSSVRLFLHVKYGAQLQENIPIMLKLFQGLDSQNHKNVWLAVDFLSHFFKQLPIQSWCLMGKQVLWIWLDECNSQHKVIKPMLRQLQEIIKERLNRVLQQSQLQSLHRMVQLIFQGQGEPISQNVVNHHPLKPIYRKLQKKRALKTLASIPLQTYYILEGSLSELQEESLLYVCRLIKYQLKMQKNFKKEKSLDIVQNLFASLHFEKAETSLKNHFIQKFLRFLVKKVQKMPTELQESIIEIANYVQSIPSHSDNPQAASFLYFIHFQIIRWLLKQESSSLQEIPILVENMLKKITNSTHKKRKLESGQEVSPMSVFVDIVLQELSQPCRFMKQLSVSTYKQLLPWLQERQLLQLLQALSSADKQLFVKELDNQAQGQQQEFQL